MDTVDALRNITTEQWGELKLPMGLVNAIKKRLAEGGASQIAPVATLPAPVAPAKDVEMIDTTTQKPATLKLNQAIEEVK